MKVLTSRTIFDLAGIAIIVAVFLVTCSANGVSFAETHKIRERGKTLVEAEGYSQASDERMKVEVRPSRSGKKNIGFFWGSAWFQMEVDVPRALNYRMSLRTSSEEGSKIEVQLVDEAGQTSLAVVEIPQTNSYRDYETTEEVIVTLPAGVHSLRFQNLAEGVNIDYITFTAGSVNDFASNSPVANDGPDRNPLKGFSSGWWRDNDDHASVGFQYIEWGKFEPRDDEFDWEYVEEVLNRAGTRGRHVILQFVVDWDYNEPVEANYLGPDWLLDKVGEERGTSDPDDPTSRQMRATCYNKPEFIEEANEAIKTLVDRLRDDPRTFVLQVGLLGFWAESHTFPRRDWSPTEKTRLAILDTYLNSLGPNGLTQVRYPDEPTNEPQPRMGYSNGSAAPIPHGYEFGNAISKDKLWMNGPVGGEWPPNVKTATWQKFFQTDEGKTFIEQAGYSTLLPPEQKEIAAKLPGWSKDDRFMKMQRRLGYNFQVKAIRHLSAADRSQNMYIEVDLHNSGIAPFYKNWNVQLAILDSKSGNVARLLPVDFDIRTLGPDKTATISCSCKEMPTSETKYQIGLRIIQPNSDIPNSPKWNLDARNVYIELANDVEVLNGKWNESDRLKGHWTLEGGWNILDVVKRREPTTPQTIEHEAFPFEGTFRPLKSQ